MTTATAAQEALPLRTHLREARTRGVRAAVALVLGVVAGYVLAEQVLDVLRTPVEVLAQSRVATLSYDTVTGAFDLRLKIAVYTGVVLSSPVWLYELVRYVSPGLTRRERRYTFGFAGAALALFAAGCATGLMVFPHMVEVLAGFASDEDATILSASQYVDFVLKLVVATGVAFVLPVVCVLLNFLGVVPARALAAGWRAVVVGIVVFSALVTPSADVLSMFLVAVPMTALYGVALLVARAHDRRAARRAVTAGLHGPDHLEAGAPCSD